MKKIRNKKEITLEVSLEEINLIFKALSQRPFFEVYELIGKINEQANRQMPSFQNKLDIRREA